MHHWERRGRAIPLRCILGRAGAGKSRRIIEEMGKDHRAGRPVILIVPDQATLVSEQAVLSGLGIQSMVDIEVLSFTRLCDRVLSQTRGAQRRFLNNRGRAMATARILGSHREALSAYQGYADSPDFANALTDTIAELKRYCVSYQQVREAAGGRVKLQDIAAIYEAYESEVSAVRMDAQDRMNLLRECIPQCKLIQQACVYIDGFEMLTKQVYEIVSALLRTARRLTVTFRLGDVRDADAAIFLTERRHYDRVIKIAEQQNASLEIVNLEQPERRPVPADLAHLEQTLYAYPARRFEGPCEHIHLYAPRDQKHQAQMCCNIIHSLAGRGMRYSEILVVTNALEKSAQPLLAAFSQQGIPAFLDIKRKVTSHPVVRYLFRCLRCLISGFSKEDVFALIKNPLCPLKMEDRFHLQGIMTAYGLKYLNEGYTLFGQDQEEYLRLRDGALGEVYRLGWAMKKRDTAQRYAARVYEFMENGLAQRFSEQTEDLEQEDADAAFYARQAYAALISALEQAHDVLGQEEMSLESFSEMLFSGLSYEEVGVLPQSGDAVVIGTSERSRTADIRALIVLDAVDGLLPRAIQKTGLMTDADQQVLESAGLFLGNDPLQRAAEEDLLVYSTLTKPKDALYLLSPKADPDGKLAQPSSVVTQIQDRFGIALEQDLPAAAAVTTPAAALSGLSEQIVRYSQGEPVNAIWADVYAVLEEKFPVLSHKKEAERGIGAEAARAFYGAPLVSATRLERFARCPFLHFVEYALRPEALQAYEQSPLEEGNYYHAGLQRYLALCQKEGVDWKEMDEKKSAALMQRAIAGIDLSAFSRFQEDPRFRLIKKKMDQTLCAAAHAVSRQLACGDFEVAATEIDFAPGGQYPPIEVTLSSGQKGYIEGRIDRIDRYCDQGMEYLRVIDYKSGDAAFSLEDLALGTSLQLPLYASAITDDTHIPCGIFTMKIRQGIPRAAGEEQAQRQRLGQHKLRGVLLAQEDVLRHMDRTAEKQSDILPVSFKQDGTLQKSSQLYSRQDILDILSYAKKKAAGLMDQIYQGEAAPYPIRSEQGGEKNSCQYCEYQALCLFDANAKDPSRSAEAVDLSQILPHRKEES